MSFTILGQKDQSNPPRPLILVSIVALDGDTVYYSTASDPGATSVTYGGNTYECRLADSNIDAIQAMSQAGFDQIPSFTLTIADPASTIWTTKAGIHGWRGATATLTFVLYDIPTQAYSTDAIQWQFLCENPTKKGANISLTATSKVNAQQIKIPSVAISYRCPWQFPTTADQRQDGADNQDSIYYRCGYSPDATGPNACGNYQTGTTPFSSCDLTKQSCVERGMFTVDSSSRTTGRFGGVTWVAPTTFVGTQYTTGRTYHSSEPGYNQANPAKYNGVIPWVYGTQWVDALPLAPAADPNSLRFEAIVCLGDVGTSGILKVICNGVEVPASDADVLFTWRYVNTGKRNGQVNGDAIFDSKGDPYGSICAIEVVIPAELGSPGSIPTLRVLVQGPVVRKAYPIATAAASGGEITFTLPTGVSNVDCAGNPPFSVTIVGNSHSAFNGTFELSNWTFGPPGTIVTSGLSLTGSGTGGFIYYNNSSSNPVWHLLDLLRKTGWSMAEINLQTFITTASYCDEPVTYTDLTGASATHARWRSSFALESRLPASQAITMLRRSCNLILHSSIESGLSCYIEQTLADQQPDLVPGSNYNTQVVSIHANGTGGIGVFPVGYLAYLFDESTIDPDSFEYTAEPLNNTPNEFTIGFQDEDNQWQSDSLKQTDTDALPSSGQRELPLALEVLGPCNFDEAGRLANLLLNKAQTGNTRGDHTGSIGFKFTTSMRAVHLATRPGYICGISWQATGLIAQQFRVLSAKPVGTDGRKWEIRGAWHNDLWYVDGLQQITVPITTQPFRGSTNGPPIPWKPDAAIPVTTTTTYSDLVIGATNTHLSSIGHPFTALQVNTPVVVSSGTGFTPGTYWINSISGGEAVLDRAVGTATSTGGGGTAVIGDPLYKRSSTFALQQGLTNYQNGTPLNSITVSGIRPINSLSAISAPRVPITASTSTASGAIPPGDYVIQICGIDSDNQYSLGSALVHATLAGTGTITLDGISFDPSTVKYDVFLGTSQFLLKSVTGQAGSPSSTITLTSLPLDEVGVRGYGPPDPSFYRFRLRAKPLTVNGTFRSLTKGASKVATISGTTITTEDGLGIAGTLMLVSGHDLTVPSPLFDAKVPLATIGPLVVGDWVQCLPQATSWSSNSIASTSLGSVPDQTGNMIRLVGGTGAGQTGVITSGAGGAYTIDGTWTTTPDSSTTFWIEKQQWSYDHECDPISVSTLDVNPVDIGTIPVDNFLGQSLLIEVLAEDQNGNFAPEYLAPIRSIYIPGAQGTRVFVATPTIRTTTITPYDGTIEVDTSAFSTPDEITLTLPAASGFPNQNLTFIKITPDKTAIVIEGGHGLQDADGIPVDGPAVLKLPYQSVTYHSDGNIWIETATVPDLSQFATKIGVQQEKYTFAVDSGPSANVYICMQTPGPGIVNGSQVVLQVAHTNTGPSTLTLALEGGDFTRDVKKESVSGLVATGLVDLSPNDWQEGQIVWVVYDHPNDVWQWIGGGSGDGISGSPTQPYHLVTFLPGKPDAGQIVLQWECPADLPAGVTFPVDFSSTGSGTDAAGFLAANPTSTATYTLNKVPAGSPAGTAGSSMGSVSISTSGVFTFACTLTTFTAGDILTATAPGTTDATLSGVGFVLPGYRASTYGTGTPAGVTPAQIQQETFIYGPDIGTGPNILSGLNLYEMVQLPPPSLLAGAIAVIKIAHTNTGVTPSFSGVSTLVVSGSAPIPVMKQTKLGLVDLQPGDWQAGDMAVVLYDGTVWQWISNKSPLILKGDLWTFGPGGDARLPVATNGMVLTADSSTDTGLDWKILPIATTGSSGVVIPDGTTITVLMDGTISSTGMLNPMTTAGDIIVGGAAGAPSRLAAGPSGYVLTSNGSGTGPTYQASGGGGGGTVTSVAITVPSDQTVSGSPVTSTGTLAITDNTQSANTVKAGPATGSPATPTYRALVAADIPAIPESGVTNLVTDLAAKVPTSRTISTTAPLTGGGDLSANRTLDISDFVGDSGSGGVRGTVPAPGAGDAAAGKYLKADGTFAVPPGTGAGAVTSVALTVPSWLTVSGSPVTSTGTLAVTATSGEPANQVLATPDGTTGAVGLRALVARDLPPVPTLAKYTASWTSQTSVTVTHNLGTTSVLVQVYDSAGVQSAPQSITITSSSVVTLAFGAAFTGSVVVIAPVTQNLFPTTYTTSWTSQTSVTVTHNLGTLNVFCQVFDGSGIEVLPQSISLTSTSALTLAFGAAFTGSVVVFAQPAKPAQSYFASWTSQTSVTVTHGLGSTAVIVQVYDAGSPPVRVAPQSITASDANTVILGFGSSFSGTVTVLG